ncbi:MAG TPA: dTDP-4-dehydrorhamnose 3,5-epimerase [Cryomorphaceae bacterium]|nr:dTDP-4-dehydrorhamnose 3,5-epimerase [Cryomorphaceae bacterium]
MIVEQTHIKDLLILKPDVFEDNRGYFMESFNANRFKSKTALEVVFVQDNESMSNRNVLRGLHFQKPPHEQGKLVRVVRGAVLDIAVDIRKGSPTYGQHVKIELTEENKWQFYVPPGFAHGFLVLKDHTIFSYKCTNYYHRESEDVLRWNDPSLGIKWGTENPILSEKDKAAQTLEQDFISPFDYV